MTGFTKLVPEIVQSSIWNEPPEIRIVWITLLAIKDENGYVRGDVRTISRMANVDILAAQQALTKFQEPDSYSHSPEYEGRRIAATDGGWMVLNHYKYRARDFQAEHREHTRKWREKKEKEACESHVTHPSVSVSVSGDGMQGKGALECNTTPTPESEFRQRLRALYGRRPTTRWSDKEFRVLKVVETAPDALEEIALIETHYAAMKGGPRDKDYRRRDIQTLLNNWTGAVDRARGYKPTYKPLL